MTDLALAPLYRPIQRPGLFAGEPLFAATGLLIGLSLAVTLPALALDPRQLLGENVWLKPIKFQIALMLYLLTLAYFARWLPAGMTARRSYRLYSATVVFAIIAELLWVGGAAMYGTASHFNVANPVMEVLYGIMGLFAVLLTSASLVHGIAIWRNPRTGLPPAVQLSIALGLVLTFILTLVTAGTMGAMPGHHVGTAVTGATVQIMGWSREVGDLRAPHFFATHAMHAVPVVGLLAGALLPHKWASTAVWAFAVLFIAFVAASFAGALAGLPLIPEFGTR